MTKTRKTVAERFWPKVAIAGPDECWLWRGARQGRYGAITEGGHAGKILRAHRVSYELAHGPIPVELTIDHLCRVPLCVNPAHLEAVTIRENLLRGDGASGRNARKTHCKYGHAFTGTNTYGYRMCHTCAAARARRYKAAKRALKDVS